MKDAEIKIRISSELKAKANMMAEKDNRTLSSYITNLIEKECNNIMNIDKSELEKNGIKLGEIDFNNFMNVYAGTRTYYLYNGIVVMYIYHTNALCYTGKNGIALVMDKYHVNNIKEHDYNDYYKYQTGITEEIFNNIKQNL